MTLKGIWGETEKYTGSITLELEEGATEPQDFYLIAYNKTNEPDYADSDVMIWHYTINPVDPNNAVAEDGTFRYTLAKTFTLSKDEAVCWRIKSDDAALGNTLAFTVNTESADTVPTKEAVVTVCTIAETTPAGTYSLPVQISTDGGRTWTDETAITFSTSELVNDAAKNSGQGNSSGGSSRGCDSVMAFCGLGAVILFMRRKMH